jgi:prepilin-type N-terminal cleavage/methylation domain-containing protein
LKTRWYSTCTDAQGFSLVELMITVAIIGMLATVAVSNFLAYRDKSLVATAVGTAEGIRTALASYASDHHDSHFPLTVDIGDWDTLRTLVNTHGGKLKPTPDEMGIQAITYTSDDGTTYILQIIVNVAPGILGRTLSVTPGSITKE